MPVFLLYFSASIRGMDAVPVEACGERLALSVFAFEDMYLRCMLASRASFYPQITLGVRPIVFHNHLLAIHNVRDIVNEIDFPMIMVSFTA